MSKEIYISSTPHETRLAIVEKDELTEIYYERENEYTLAGSIYNGRVTRVLPGMQSSFVDIGLERDAFLYITDFMEEAGDSADFEASSSNSHSRREPRSESRTERPVRTEALPEVSSEGRSSESRSPEGRSEGGREGRREGRGGRDRGRGRGRRDRNSTSTPGSSPETRRDAEPSYPESTSYEEPAFAPTYDEEPIEVATGEPDNGVIGEGAPGADGSRRWRGRRGRRRGRGLSSEISSAESSTGEEDGEISALEAQAESAPEPSAPRPSAADEFPSAADVQAVSVPASAEPRGEGGRDRDRGRRDRGGRNRGRDRGQGSPAAAQDSRQDSVRERFAPRGARPAPVEDAPAEGGTAVAATIEPFILPGESLSKYRAGGETQSGFASAATASNVTFVTAKPTSEVTPLLGWDGGAVLPGETLSRRRESPQQSRQDSSGERSNDRGSDRRRERDERRGRGGRDDRGPRTPVQGAAEAHDAPAQRQHFAPSGLDPAEAVQPAVTSQHEIEPTTHIFTDDAPDFAVAATEARLHAEHAAHADEVHAHIHQPAAEQTQPHTQAQTVEHVEEFHETVAEYEPGEDASASYRVDPAGTREFRQSSTVDEAPVLAEHEITAVHADGHMIAEPTPETVATPAAETHAATDHVPAAAHEDTQHFAPGHGQIEEEFLDEEEGEGATIHAAAQHHDDAEEEALEHAADLGSMIRDMTIDEITRPEPVELEGEEDDDFDIDEEEMEEDELSHGEQNGHNAEFDSEDRTEGEHEEYAETPEEGEFSGATANEGAPREGLREGREGGRRNRRDGRRGGRDRDRSSERGAPVERSVSADRSSSTDRTSIDRSPSERGTTDRASSDRSSRDRRGMAGSRSGGGRSGGRHSVQAMDLPAISDLLKPGQEVLVQIAKEPIAKKGARITSHIALPGRFLVFMPTVSHVGVSRKIESDGERRRLKEILLSERGEASGGFIVRTAASGASEEELRSDLRFLLNLWTDIKARSESSKSPALIYHDLNLIERILRDQVTDNFSAIWVDTESEYERVVRFLQRFQPSLVRRVKLYGKDVPLFEQFGITEEINKALRSKVWLKSGGSIVINQTEALVAIDINTGKYVGKTARLEDTIVKTNLDAIPEIVRQIRLRDLGGIIIIDFIDMDERKNRNKVMAALEEELKSDRAPSKVLQFNDFGLVAITRKRVKQSLERTLSTTCGVCAGTGMVKSPVTVCNDIYIEMRKMHKLIEKGDIMLRVNPEVVKQLKTGGGKWLQEMEEMSGKTILVKSDPSLHPEQFDIH